MNELYEKYHSKGLQIIAYPCSQFTANLMMDEEEIAKFKEDYNIRFPIM